MDWIGSGSDRGCDRAGVVAKDDPLVPVLMMTCGCFAVARTVAEASSSRVCFEVLETGSMLAMGTGDIQSRSGVCRYVRTYEPYRTRTSR